MNNTTTHKQSTKTKPSKVKCRTAIILMQSKSLQDDISLEEKLLNLAAKHNLSVIRTIKRKAEYDADMLDRLVNTIKEQQQPVTIITENCEYIYSSNILGCCVIGTLVKYGLIELISYGRDVSGNMFLYFPTIDNIKFFQIAEMHLWNLMNGKGIKAANKQLIQNQNEGN